MSAINRRVGRKSFLLALTAATILGATWSESQAGTLTATFAVSATVAGAACSSISATALSFGNVPATGTASSTSTVTVNCALSTTYSISAVGATPGCYGSTFGLYNAMAPQGTVNLDVPSYQLFKDAAHSLPLLAISGGGGCAGTPGTAITGTGSGVAQTLTVYGIVYGTVPGNPTSAPGNYTDTATVTVTF